MCSQDPKPKATPPSPAVCPPFHLRPVPPLLVLAFSLCKGDRGIDALGNCSRQNVTYEVSSMWGGGNDRCAKPLAAHGEVLRPPDLWPSWRPRCSQLYWLLLRPVGEGQERSPSRHCHLTPGCPLGRGCLCPASLGVPGLGCCHLMGAPSSLLCAASTLPGGLCSLSRLPVIWILEATVEATRDQVPFCD